MHVPFAPAHRASRLALATLALAACTAGDSDAASDSPAAAGADSATADSAAGAPALVGPIDGMRTPESVLHDPDQDVYFVSNVAGNPSEKDGNGFIARVPAEQLGSPQLDFIRGGRTGITLNAPKGMAIVGDTLWVADIDAVRGFNRKSGRPVAMIDLAPLGATFLNDIAVGPGDTLYVTDTGIRFDATGSMSHPGTDRVFAIAGRTPSVALEGTILSAPNGVTWDSAGTRLLVAPFSGPTPLAWTPGGRAPNPKRLAAGPGSFDGIALLADGRVVVSSWADSSVYAMQGDSTMTRLITGLEAPADIGVDRQRGRILVPLFNQNRVVVYAVR
ncbi:MAG TPA: hypothetical protein VFS08_10300 [Gemmatimonadaceae bacterium]|nr:hypothetical protein [Gemmatimonadaceae bacterium]